MSKGITRKTRTCQKPGCGKVYVPTGNRQQYCPEHSGKVQERLRAAKRARSVPVLPLTYTTSTPALERVQVDRRTPIAELLAGLAGVLEQGKGRMSWELKIGPML